MLIREIRAMTDQQHREELEKSNREMMNLPFRAATNQLTNSNLPRSLRKTIARLRTALRERELVEE